MGVHDVGVLRRMAKGHDLTYEVLGHGSWMSGVVIVTSKAAWTEVGGFCDGFLGVDNDYHLRLMNAGLACHMQVGNPVYHYWRADGDMQHVHAANQLHHNPFP